MRVSTYENLGFDKYHKYMANVNKKIKNEKNMFNIVKITCDGAVGIKFLTMVSLFIY
ncbi:hypothetical protein TRIP_B360076 [uncultured Desulfatiglans sp.]|uniref:Uncharacterized protein n=1 Tax=Uncultured Desulfatiglans sp. TaxID=1748965 RepID=A0A653AD36_UNCDX|nr:hypothetical protein TRIP_B360076 [uncultured Desulfatiglans sp.]